VTPVAVVVVGALNVDGVRRTSPIAQLAANALLQAVRMPVELVATVVTRLGGTLDLWVLLGLQLAKHRRKSDAESGDLRE
jgi:hypothetical protein